MDIYSQYKKEITYLESLHNISDIPWYGQAKHNPDIYKKRLRYFLKILGNPQRKIKNYIHIGGTSGKGSVANYIANILVASGKKTGLFTSPFVTETIEKYKINDHFISCKEFVNIINELKPAIDECATKSPYGVPSYFEICYAIAILFFTQNKCEYVVCEVGLGGEFDATNIVNKSRLSIITHVDYDHTDILGNTLNEIAQTKSKIIKPNSVFMTAENRPAIRKIFKNECSLNNTKFYYINTVAQDVKHIKNKFVFVYKKQKYELNQWGQHQVSNAILAIEAAKELNINNEYIVNGLKNTKTPARFEIVNKRPCIILDVAHNPDKIKTTLDNLGLLNYNKFYLVYASAANKDTESIAKLFANLADQIYITRFFNIERKCASPRVLYKSWVKYNKKDKIKISLDPYIALEKTIKRAKPSDCILIVGSFYLIGELRKKWYSSEKILRTKKVI